MQDHGGFSTSLHTVLYRIFFTKLSQSRPKNHQKRYPNHSPDPPGSPWAPLVTDPVSRPLPESTFYDFGTPSGTPLAAKMGPWRAKKGPRCDKSIKKIVPEGVSEKNIKKRLPISWMLVPPGTLKIMLSLVRGSSSHFFDASQKCHQKALHLGPHFEVFGAKNR